jgi:hypothetical protein
LSDPGGFISELPRLVPLNMSSSTESRFDSARVENRFPDDHRFDNVRCPSLANLPSKWIGDRSPRRKKPSDPLDPTEVPTEAEQMRRLASVHEQTEDKRALAAMLARLPGVDPSDPAFDELLRS